MKIIVIEGEERRLMHLVPAPAVSLMKSEVSHRQGVNSVPLISFASWISLCLLLTALHFLSSIQIFC